MSFRIVDSAAQTKATVYTLVPKVVPVVVTNGSFDIPIQNGNMVIQIVDPIDTTAADVDITMTASNMQDAIIGYTLTIQFKIIGNHAVNLFLPERFLITACGDESTQVSYRGTRVSVTFTYDGEYFLNIIDNC